MEKIWYAGQRQNVAQYDKTYDPNRQNTSKYDPKRTVEVVELFSDYVK